VGLSLEPVTMTWFLCLYVNVLPFETVLHVWDCLFNEGIKVMYRVGLTLLHLKQRVVMEAQNTDEVLLALKDFRDVSVDSVHFLKQCFTYDWLPALSMKEIATLRAEETIIVSSENAERSRKKQAFLLKQRLDKAAATANN
jgi:hypothetical protein